jgi:hypothetical protein
MKRRSKRVFPGSKPPDDEPAARAAVERAYAGMMTADEEGNVDAGEGGFNLGSCLEEARQRHGVVVSAGAPGATVKADMIRLVNDHEARVLFTISIGPPINQNFGGRIGRATCLDGQWKVARDTFCELQMADVQCPPMPAEMTLSSESPDTPEGSKGDGQRLEPSTHDEGVLSS